jgi:hypothetical protein
MTALPSVTGTIDNTTSYTLSYVSHVVENGSLSLGPGTVPAGARQQAFRAQGVAGGISPCQGSVTYGFTDEQGGAQELTLYYSDPIMDGKNEFSATVPNGMSCTNDGSADGNTRQVTWTLSGTVTPSAGS